MGRNYMKKWFNRILLLSMYEDGVLLISTWDHDKQTKTWHGRVIVERDHQCNTTRIL